MAQFVNDSFTASNGTLLSAHTGEVGASWTASNFTTGTARIDANRAHANTNATGWWFASGLPTGAEYDLTIVVNTVTAVQAVGMLARGDPASADVYWVNYSRSTGTLTLFRVIGGSPTSLGTYSVAFPVGEDHTITFEVRNAAKRVFGARGAQMARVASTAATATVATKT